MAFKPMKGYKPLNIFRLDDDPVKAARYHCDKHCVKMVTEYAQMLSTAQRLIDGELYEYTENGKKKKHWILYDGREECLYKVTHPNHPCNIWVRESSENYQWLFDLYKALSEEYTHRYGKYHKAYWDLASSLCIPPYGINKGPQTPLKLAISEEKCIVDNDPVQSYRNFYHYKPFKMTWKNRQTPEWYKKNGTLYTLC